MPIRKTQAIPLYWSDVSNTSRIVTWLTARHGKISTLIKGDQRRKSPFRGQYDLFSTSELLFYDRAERGVQIAKECMILHPRTIFRSDWRACAAAGYIAALFAKTTPRHAHEPRLFPFFEEMLSHAESASSLPAFLVWFDLHFAAFHGQGVNLSPPPETTPGEPLRFSALQGGLVSSREARQHNLTTWPVSPSLLDALTGWQKALLPLPEIEHPTAPALLRQADRLIAEFMLSHFDLHPRVRRTAAGILSAG